MMDIRKVHILIEQGLQQVGVFAYDDFEHEEVDLEIDKAVYKIIKSAFNPIRQDNQFQYNQGVLDRIKSLQKTDEVLNVTKSTDFVYSLIPEDYVHTLRVESIVSKSENCRRISCNKIEVDKNYKVISGTVIYNNVEYNTGDTFEGVIGQDKMELVPPIEDIKIVELKTRTVETDIAETTKVRTLLSNSLSTTKVNRPLGEITEDSIRVYFSNFDINQILFSYIRKPSPVNFNFQRFTSGDSLQPIKEYEVIRGTINYDGNTFGAGQKFTTSSIVSFTGTGTVKLFQDGDLNLPSQVCYDVINEVVQQLAIISEQNQQKIANLVQTSNVPS